MDKLIPFIVVLLVAACGQAPIANEAHSFHIETLEGFEIYGDRRARILSTLGEFNSDVGIEAFTASSGIAIEISLVAGGVFTHAIADGDACLIEMAVELTNDLDNLKRALYHQVGDCVGLEHKPSRGEIMSPTFSKLANTPVRVLQTFAQDFLASASK